MKLKRVKKIMSVVVAAMVVFNLAACGGSGDGKDTANTPAGTESSKDDGKEESDTKEKDSSEDKEGTTSSSDAADFTELKLGEDYTDISADLKFLTHRSDLADTVFQDYIKEFQKLYPNINITYEAVTDYAEGAMLRLTTGDWGDICMIPTNIDKSEYENYFVNFGDKAKLEEKYIMLEDRAYENKVYGMPSVGTAQGIVYNKQVFEDAGVTELPKTPEDFIAALQKIKDNTEAIPLYTNFAAGWTMSAWDAYIGGSATGDADFMNTDIVHGDNPFSDRGDGTGPYAVYNVLYEAVAKGLIEDDPSTTDWEGSKGMLNNGEIGVMVLGSWAVTQMQDAGEHPDDIGYMSFPISIDGKQYASAGPDYAYGINVNSSEDNQIASMLYIKWLIEESNFAYDQGGIPILVDGEYPDVYEAFKDIELVINKPAPEGEETLFDDINNDSELGLNVSADKINDIVESALDGSKTMEDIMTEWNQKWTASQEKFEAK